jgi:tRNA(Ile)-lysidine synthase
MIDIEKHICDNFTFIKGKKLLVAFSGGLDSTVLLHALIKLYGSKNISAAHVNFHLRGEDSDLDQEFCKNFAAKNSIDFFTKSVNTKEYSKKHTISLEMAARDLRYQWFNELITEHKFDYLLVAHHNNDNFETSLLNLIRGTGISGLRGMLNENKNIIRPLLEINKSDIVNYAELNKIQWREDLSNNSDEFKRNIIRNKVVPIFEEMNPNLLNGFKKTSHLLRLYENIYKEYLDKFKSKVIEDDVSIIRISIKKIKEFTSYQLLFSDVLKDFGFTNTDDVISVMDSHSGKEFFSKNYRLVKDRDYYLLKRIDTSSKIEKYSIDLDSKIIKAPLNIKIEKTNNSELSKSNNVEKFDLDKLKGKVILRKHREGDYFYPTGMIGKKKVSKYFKDEKMSLFDKENQWLMCIDSHIVWIVGKRADRRFTADKGSENIIKLELI